MRTVAYPVPSHSRPEPLSRSRIVRVRKATFDQVGFRARNDDGSETTATWKAAENADWTQLVDEVFRLRFVIDEIEGVSSPQIFGQLQRNLNGAGWVNVHGTSTVAQSAASAFVADLTVCTRQLTSGVGTFHTGEFESGNGIAHLGGANPYPAGEFVESEWCLKILSADVVDGDTIQFRLIRNTGAAFDVYSEIPIATVSEGGAVTGTIAVTQEDQTSTIAGTSVDNFTGTIAVTQDDQTSSISGTSTPPPVTGTIAVTQDDQTSAITGVLGYSGTIAITQEDQTSAISGTVAGPGATTGTIAVTQEDQTSAISGTVVDVFTGTIAVTQADQTSTISGTVTAPPITGTIAVTQDDQTGALAGWISIFGTVAVTQADQVSSITGTVTGAVPDIGWPVIVVEEPKTVTVTDPIQSVLVVDPDPNVVVTDPDQVVVVEDDIKSVVVSDPTQTLTV